MKLISTAALALVAAMPAMAADTLVDFETVTGFASIDTFYSGGTDSEGNTGPALGVAFGGDALGLVNDFDTYFSNAPTAMGTMTPVGSDATMNVAAGFTGRISFAYAASEFVAQGVNVYSGLDGTGALLASFNLVGNATAGCADSAFCRFDTLSSSFFGTARSVTFGNAANLAVFDDISITAVPEPATVLMLSLGLAGLMLAQRRRG